MRIAALKCPVCRYRAIHRVSHCFRLGSLFAPKTNFTSLEVNMKSGHSWAFILLVSVGLLTPAHVYADAMAFSSINFSNLQITASTGSVTFGSSWMAQGF